MIMDPKGLEDLILETTIELLRRVETRLPEDVASSLREAMNLDTSMIAKRQLKMMLENVELAEEEDLPICQDTGIIIFYLKVGEKFPILERLPKILSEAVRKATIIIPLRFNAVNPFSAENGGDETGCNVPIIWWDICEGETLDMTVLLKGGGSENVSVLKMLDPVEGVRGIKKAVVDAVLAAGAKPCPPIIVGVGIGGSSEIALKLANKALLRSIGERHIDDFVNRLERELLDLINETGIGTMGLGGRITTLNVNVEYAHRHPASLPVGVVLQCWAARSASAKITSEGIVEYHSR